MSSMSDLEAKEFKLLNLHALVEEGARLRKEVKKARTEASSFDALLKSLQSRHAEATTVRDDVAALLSATVSATKRNKYAPASFSLKVTYLAFLKEREALLKRRLNATELKLSSLEFENASLC